MKSKTFILLCIGLILTIDIGLYWKFDAKPALLSECSFSHAIYDENQHLLRLTLTQDEKFRLWTPLSDISQEMITATLLKEDEYF